ncbi:MAG: DEAD/DEAH box helicase family protein [Chloroflexota bacterium]|nr:DEAD/DEAH box helicase family protein [Chloroflexota bacterium]MDE2883938.1 DEAD/DEAH box helicase family protein [Chloroflexota bacterium]
MTTDDLERYNDNIRGYLGAMNAGRSEPITLRYFQYLAALYAEIYLDRYYSDRDALLRSLNEFVDRSAGWYEPFQGGDLSKLAFWMATGSGKTLLLHLNYRQFLHYNRRYGGAPLDNILLITPNEGLSQQHIGELEASNISASRFNLNEPGGLLGGDGTVKVTEVTKLVMNKRGEGESVPVEAFEGNNLIFVDEGHKGASSEAKAWRKVRDALGETGFTFEYSATFGQALAAAKDEALLKEYGKAIAFDYSYRHFHADGYGKDFRILNLQQETTSDQTDTLLLANMLAFYEQQLVFAELGELRSGYKLDRPLWLFVGNTVQKKENSVYQSDLFTVIRFLHRVLSEPAWARERIGAFLRGDSGLPDASDGRDIFADEFAYLRSSGKDATTLYSDMLAGVLHVTGVGGLHVVEMKGCEGELGLRSAGSDEYFGVLYIGDTASFKEMVRQNDGGIVVEDDALHGSLFNRINDHGSTVEVLAGSRKFMEGWNSWRVSNMGLLNIGHGEGSQIIQLFGRGVRLRGRNMTLKRSAALPGEAHPKGIGLLETLNIFALRADYMGRFRDYLENEGIEETITLPLPIQTNEDFLKQGLVIPRLEQGARFDESVLLRYDSGVRPVSVDLSARVQVISSGESGVAVASAQSGGAVQVPSESLDLVDWERVYLDLLAHKETRGYGNLIIQPIRLREILEAGEQVYELTADESLRKPSSRADQERLQDAVASILRKYADRLYARRQSAWESRNLIYKELDDTDENFLVVMDDEGKAYTIEAPRSEPTLLRDIRRLINDVSRLYDAGGEPLPRIHFDRHLYQPLLVEPQRKGVKVLPPALQESERKFVDDLREFCGDEPRKLPDGVELFLLRNLTRGRGVGFFEMNWFYPDFILWVKRADGQRIVFVEPHGMVHAYAYEQDEKAQLHERLPALANAIAQRSPGRNVQLDSFIVSATKYDVLRPLYGDGDWTRDDFAAKHILFPDRNADYDYIANILEPLPPDPAE